MFSFIIKTIVGPSFDPPNSRSLPPSVNIWIGEGMFYTYDGYVFSYLYYFDNPGNLKTSYNLSA